MATVSDLNKGSYIRYNGEVVQVEELQHRTPGNLRAFYQIKMRNVRNGKIVENRFRPGDGSFAGPGPPPLEQSRRAAGKRSTS